MGTDISSTAVTATTNRTMGRFAARKSTISWPKMTRIAMTAIVVTSNSGASVKKSLPGRLRRFHARPTTVIYLSTPPMMGSREAITAIVSAIR